MVYPATERRRDPVKVWGSDEVIGGLFFFLLRCHSNRRSVEMHFCEREVRGEEFTEDVAISFQEIGVTTYGKVG